jgi:hypothetical protein
MNFRPFRQDLASGKAAVHQGPHPPGWSLAKLPHASSNEIIVIIIIFFIEW